MKFQLGQVACALGQTDACAGAAAGELLVVAIRLALEQGPPAGAGLNDMRPRLRRLAAGHACVAPTTQRSATVGAGHARPATLHCSGMCGLRVELFPSRARQQAETHETYQVLKVARRVLREMEYRG